jgi:hypothetical protein
MHSIHRHIHHHYGTDLGSARDRWGGRTGRRGRRGRGPGREGRDLDAVIAFLEERQRDFEQAAADVAAKIQRLKERRDAASGSSTMATASSSDSTSMATAEPAGAGADAGTTSGTGAEER